MERLDYDFPVMEKKTNSFIGKFGASVVNLGCGLDQTAENATDDTCNIYNLDFEDVLTSKSKYNLR